MSRNKEQKTIKILYSLYTSISNKITNSLRDTQVIQPFYSDGRKLLRTTKFRRLLDYEFDGDDDEKILKQELLIRSRQSRMYIRKIPCSREFAVLFIHIYCIIVNK